MRNVTAFFIAILSLLPLDATAAPMITARTVAVTFDAATMRVNQTTLGSCWTTSIASRRRDAFRCSVVNSIHDPCFRINALSVACPTNLAANSGIRIRLTKPLPPPMGISAHNPFMMQLAGGISCNVGTGTVIPDYPFYCSGNLVCAAPSSNANPRAVFVQCGRPKNGMTVTRMGRYLVRVMYR